MPVVIIFLLIAGAIAIAWLYPHLRALALGVLMLFLVIFAGAWLMSGNETAREAERIGLDEVTLSDLVFSDDPRVARLSGRVANGSPLFRLREMEIRVTLHDCPAPEAELESCAIIADALTTARVDVPPGQVRRFEGVLRFSARPEPDGLLRWHHTLEATRATE